MLEVEKAGGVVLHSQSGKVAIITNEFGLHALPKGSPEPDETLEKTARREVYEETGLKNISLVRKIGVLRRRGYASAQSTTHDIIKNIHFYLFTTDHDALSPLMNDSIQATWVDAGDLAATLSWSEEYEFLQRHCPELFS